MHQHKSFRLGTEHALCRNRGGRWWIWYKKPFVNSRLTSMNLTRKAVERAWLATRRSRHSASKSIAKNAYTPRDCPQVFGLRTLSSGCCQSIHLRFSETVLGHFFFDPLELHIELPDLLVQLGGLRLICRFIFAIRWTIKD